MTVSAEVIHALAHTIELETARRIVAANPEPRRGARRTRKERIAHAYDPHAATELAGLIARTLGLPS